MANENFQYRKAKPLHAVMAMCNYFSLTLMYGLIGYASYVANVGYGMASAIIGVVLMASRIYDGVSDPVAAIIIEKTKSRLGKIRLWSIIGWIIETGAVILMFSLMSGKGFGTVTFILLYLLFVTGYTLHACAVSITAPVLSNEPGQRARLGAMAIAFNTLSYVFCVVLVVICLLPKFGNQYTVPMLSKAAIIIGMISFAALVIAIIGVSPYDKKKNYEDMERRRDKAEGDEKFGLVQIIKGNKPLRKYILAAASDGLATQIFTQSIVVTLMYGVLTGNYQLGTMINALAIIPAIVFSFIATRYAAKHGNKKALQTWAACCIITAAISVVFFMSIDTRLIPSKPVFMVGYIVLMAAILSLRTCVSSSTSSMMADVVDYELYRSGHYVPAIVSAIYSFTNKLVSSLAALIAISIVSLADSRYKDILPQPTDDLTPELKIATMFLFYGVMVLAWIMILLAMRGYSLDKERMKEIQMSLADEPVDKSITVEDRQRMIDEDFEEFRKKRIEFLRQMKSILDNSK